MCEQQPKSQVCMCAEGYTLAKMERTVKVICGEQAQLSLASGWSSVGHQELQCETKLRISSYFPPQKRNVISPVLSVCSTFSSPLYLLFLDQILSEASQGIRLGIL